MKILALDVSTKSTGWFITKKSCGKIVPDKTLSFGEKLVFFRKELDKLLRKYKPDVVVIEDAYYRPGFGNIHTLKTLVKFAGVAIELCTSYGIETEVITATTARKHCCGEHTEKFGKPEVFKFFVEKFGLQDWTYEEHNDLTDAMALSWGYREIKRTQKKSDTPQAGD
jgi:Holliday junction resolvasome RuvABC endonuclease subunit